MKDKKEVIVGNNIIQDFEGSVGVVPEYNEYWDLLMPVVEKIESLSWIDGRGEVSFIVTIEIDQCIISLGGEESIVEVLNQESKIGAVHKAIVEFIKWYKDIDI